MSDAPSDQELKHAVRSVRAICRKYLKSPVDQSDLYSAGLEGVAHAVRKYDPSKGTFSAYSRRWVCRYVMTEYIRLRSVVRRPRPRTAQQALPAQDITVNAPRPGFHEDSDDWIEELPNHCDSPEAYLIQRESIAAYLSAPPQRRGSIDAAAVLRRRLDGRSQEDLASEFGIKRTRVGQLEHDALARANAP